MPWLTVILIIVLLFALTALISGSIIFVQYCNSPVKLWSKEVLTLLGNARRKLRAEKDKFQRLGKEKQADADDLTEKAFRRFLASISVDQLQAYPGIGAGTATKLRESGHQTLAHTPGARVRI